LDLWSSCRRSSLSFFVCRLSSFVCPLLRTVAHAPTSLFGGGESWLASLLCLVVCRPLVVRRCLALFVLCRLCLLFVSLGCACSHFSLLRWRVVACFASLVFSSLSVVLLPCFLFCFLTRFPCLAPSRPLRLATSRPKPPVGPCAWLPIGCAWLSVGPCAWLPVGCCALLESRCISNQIRCKSN